MPSAVPASVGTITAQPMSPIIPRPNQTPCVALRCALSLRATFAATSRLKSESSLTRLALGFEVLVAGHDSSGLLGTALQLIRVSTHRAPPFLVDYRSEEHTSELQSL